MTAAANIALKTVRLANKAVDTVVVALLALLVLANIYTVWDSHQVYEKAKAAQYAAYKPTGGSQGHSFSELRAANPDVFGWLTVYGTQIDYPLVQGADNRRYVNANALGEYSLSGAIFLDARCARDFSDFSSIIYGHHMEKQTMFGEIGLFAQKEYFDARPAGMLYFDGKAHGLEFFAFVHCDAYDTTVYRTNIAGREAQEAYLELILGKAVHTRDMPVTADDRIVLLSTCSGTTTNGRDILVGKITEQVQGDVAPKASARKGMLSVDMLPGLWLELPFWVKAGFFMLPLMVLYLVAKYRRMRRKRNLR